MHLEESMSDRQIEKLNNDIFELAMDHVDWYVAGDIADKITRLLKKKRLLRKAA
jgi:hypothetical protein